VSASVVGLDLSMTATGIAERDGRTYTYNPGVKGDHRLTSIRKAVGLAVGQGVDLVVIEDAVVRSPAAVELGMVHGVVRPSLLAVGVRYVLIAPATLKKYATGKGNATKPDMRMALYQRMGIDLRDDNQVDATWLRYAGLQLLGEPVVQLPASQVAALDKVRAQLGEVAS
jgi:Holliday junction resolvasome RuvABC endonuclease subunit